MRYRPLVSKSGEYHYIVTEKWLKRVTAAWTALGLVVGFLLGWLWG